ncbi:MAG: M56 family metallopeptidase [Acidobacteria bacterium]|nr:M56 family metallopeptidase [Acidobacteriota bacterium]
MAEMWLSNIASWSAQIAILVLAGACLPSTLRLRLPGARLIFWQALLLACLAIRLLQPWRREVIRLAPASSAREVAIPVSPPAAPPAGPAPWPGWALAVLGGGAAARLAWLAAGIRRIARYRRRSFPFEGGELLRDLEWQVGSSARVCVSERVAGPVTFGVIEPVILVPPGFTDMPAAAQRAILCHELLHVRRRDWLATIAEEMLGALLWFHPAVWWLLSRIRLAREQTVDRAVVRLTTDRDRYLATLLAIAGARLEPDLAPATLFLRRRHLVQRVSFLMKGGNMSIRHLAAASTGLTILSVAAGFVAIRLFPLKAAPQILGQEAGQRIAVETSGFKILHRSTVSYPREARAKRIEGAVTLDLTIAADGTVSDARVAAGPEELRRAALQNFLQWHFANDSQRPGTTQVTIEFRLPPEGAVPAAPVVRRESLPGPEPSLRALRKFNLEFLPAALREKLEPELGPLEGQLMDNALLERVRRIAENADSHLYTRVQDDTISLLLRETGNPELGHVAVMIDKMRTAAAGAEATGNTARDMSVMVEKMVAAAQGGTPGGDSSVRADRPGSVRVGGQVQASKLISAPAPQYPPLARQARIQGTVRFNVVIGHEGSVQNLTLINGHPLLVPPAQEAVRQYLYQPTLLNGQPVEVITTVDVNFVLEP